MNRAYRLGRRQAAVDRTSQAILEAGRQAVADTPAGSPSVGAIARRAGVSRLTIYNRFGSKAGLLRALAPQAPRTAESDPADPPRDALYQRLLDACTSWAADPSLYRHLPTAEAGGLELDRRLAERLAVADALRPGCSIKEAEDVIGALASFAVFDRLHKDGRRSPGAVADVLMRLAAGILA
ncbi:MAG TPA: helix-turn-helix domain-containing protein [Candidatus Dormibacteraeota bacterium]|nr:helix-turn-helix domain-containing protein [Candidatus Dormibacteraeota bacterium]